MVEKTLSAGTLGLRFMQNARRTQQLNLAETGPAHVKDDAEWEVAKEVRDSWGVVSGSENQPTISYEPSYLPFLFPSLPHPPGGDPLSSDAEAKPIGRRVFNKHGQEVPREQQVDDIVPTTSQDKIADGHASDNRPRQPVSISGPSSPAAKHSIKTRVASKEAKRLIYDNSGVGADLRPPPPLHTPSSAPSDSGFLKPSGVDFPSQSHQGPNRRKRDTADHASRDEVIPGARKSKVKRTDVAARDGISSQKKLKMDLIE